ALGKALPWLAVGLLVASVPAFRVIPFGPFWGWDLENLFVFHRCTAPAATSHWLARNAPYLLSGHACADSAGRAMYYPPLVYWSFTWLRLLPLFAAVRLWAVVILLGVCSLPLFWLPAGERLPTRAWRLYLLWLLMLAQFPVIFSIERANV